MVGDRGDMGLVFRDRIMSRMRKGIQSTPQLDKDSQEVALKILSKMATILYENQRKIQASLIDPLPGPRNELDAHWESMELEESMKEEAERHKQLVAKREALKWQALRLREAWSHQVGAEMDKIQ